MKKNRKKNNTNTQETLKLRTNVNIEWDWKQQEDLRKKNEIKLYNFYMLSNILSYHASPAESTVRSSFPSDSAYPCHLNVLELLRLFYCFIFEIHHLERTPRPSESIPSCMIVFKRWDLAVLLCEIARCILLNVQSNNDRPQLLAVVIWKTLEALLSTSSEFDPFCCWSPASQVVSAPWMSAFGSLPLSPNAQQFSL